MKKITKYVIKNSFKRMLLYRVALLRLKRMGVNRVFSYTIGAEVGVSADQVRKDFAEYQLRGIQKGGYIINEILASMEIIFFENQRNNLIIVGMGNIGQALAKYNNYVLQNMNIVATFDADPFKQKTKFGVPVYSPIRMKEIIDRFKVRVAILAIPEIFAQDVCNDLVKCGIKGIVNFAPVLLKVPADIVVNNINLCDELESVIYQVHIPV